MVIHEGEPQSADLVKRIQELLVSRNQYAIVHDGRCYSMLNQNDLLDFGQTQGLAELEKRLLEERQARMSTSILSSGYNPVAELEKLGFFENRPKY